MKFLFPILLLCACLHLSTQDYKVVCYFTDWAFYRENDGAYYPSNIDPDLCTHINYAFATLDENELVIKPYDTWADIDNNFYNDVIAYKQYGIKVLISMGGWSDSTGDKYSRLVNDAGARANFNQNVLAFIQQYGFDGLDIDWEYPKCWQGDCYAGPDSDRENFATWIIELNALFAPYGYQLSAAVSASSSVISEAYDVPTLSAYLTHINLMTYDYHGTWDSTTAHVSSLYPDSDYTVNYWISLGADPAKLILGIPFYGNSYTLSDPSNNGYNAPVSGGGNPGDITATSGSLAFNEICNYVINEGWTVVRDYSGNAGPYAYSYNQWVAYDDIQSVQAKSEYVESKGLGGAMIWTLDDDDFWNRCNCDTYPLLKTINRVLRGYPASTYSCPLIGG